MIIRAQEDVYDSIGIMFLEKSKQWGRDQNVTDSVLPDKQELAPIEINVGRERVPSATEPSERLKQHLSETDFQTF